MPDDIRKVLRKMLTDNFTDDEFTIFCFDHFPEFQKQVTDKTPLAIKAMNLTDYCRNRGKLLDLKRLIEQERPTAYLNAEEADRETPDNVAFSTSAVFPTDKAQPVPSDVELSTPPDEQIDSSEPPQQTVERERLYSELAVQLCHVFDLVIEPLADKGIEEPKSALRRRLNQFPVVEFDSSGGRIAKWHRLFRDSQAHTTQQRITAAVDLAQLRVHLLHLQSILSSEGGSEHIRFHNQDTIVNQNQYTLSLVLRAEEVLGRTSKPTPPTIARNLADIYQEVHRTLVVINKALLTEAEYNDHERRRLE